MKIIVCGDICFNSINENKACEGDVNTLFTNAASLIKNADISICNLECPLTDSNIKLQKSGPNLKASAQSVNVLSKVGFNIVSLANNHILDYGEIGVKDTIFACESKGIKTVGAANNFINARKPCIVENNGLKIGFYSVADNECASATEDSYGANGFDYCETFDDVRKASELCDALIVLYHTGLEHYQYQSPDLQKRCKKIADCGAKAVICQHSHCIGTFEEHNGSLILYGQGNFLFAKEGKDEKWNTALLLEFNIEKEGFSWRFLPSEIKDGHVELADDDKAKHILNELYRRSDEVENDTALYAKWDEFNRNRIGMYWNVLMCWPRLIYIANKLLNNRIVKLLVPKRKAIVVENIIRCESHRESLQYIIHHRYI